jgi:hypothetical protein
VFFFSDEILKLFDLDSDGNGQLELSDLDGFMKVTVYF